MDEENTNLDLQERLLTNKINAMEKSIPAILAFQLLNSPDESISLGKIIETINKISCCPDPVEKIEIRMKKDIKKIINEIDYYHEKIIKAEFEINEIGTEIEEIDCLNVQLQEKINTLELELRGDNESLYSVDSEEFECLKKIRQLGENELRMRNKMKELGDREATLREQIKQILANKNYDKCPQGNGQPNSSGCKCLSMAKEFFEKEDTLNYNQSRHRGCQIWQNEHSCQFNLGNYLNQKKEKKSNKEHCKCCKCKFDEDIIDEKNIDKKKFDKTKIEKEILSERIIDEQKADNENEIQKEKYDKNKIDEHKVDETISKKENLIEKIIDKRKIVDEKKIEKKTNGNKYFAHQDNQTKNTKEGPKHNKVDNSKEMKNKSETSANKAEGKIESDDNCKMYNKVKILTDYETAEDVHEMENRETGICTPFRFTVSLYS